MGDTINKALGLVIHNLSDENYAESLASYRFWLDIGQIYYQTPLTRYLRLSGTTEQCRVR